MKSPFGILIMIGLAASIGAYAASTPLTDILASRPLVNKAVTIDEAVGLALKHSPVVLGSAADVDAAVQRLRAARAEKRPWVSANGLISDGSTSGIMATPPPSQPSAIMMLPGERFTDLNLSLMVPLYTGGRLEGMIRKAAALKRASESDLAAQRQETALMTRTAFHTVIARRELVKVAQARLTDDEERLKNDRARFEQQAIPEYYLRRDEAEVASAQQGLTEARRDADISLIDLKTVMGVNPASQLDVSGGLGPPAMAEFLAGLTSSSGTTDTDELPALLLLAERQRPELAAAHQRVDGARGETSSIRGSYRPQISIGVMGDWMKAGSMRAEAGTTAAVIASMPLYNGGQREARIREAEAMRVREEQDRQQTALQVAREVETALLNLRAANQQVTTADIGLKAARAEYDAARLRFEAGRSIMLEVLDAQASRIKAEGDVVQALYDFNVAQDQLLRAVGGMTTQAAR